MPLLDEYARLKAQLEKQDSRVLDRLLDAYGNSYERITPEIDALIEYITAQMEAGKLTKKTVASSAAYKNLISSVEQELTDYTGFVKTEIRTSSNDAAKSGLSAGRFLLLVALADSLNVDTKDVPRELVKQALPGALDFLAEYLDPRGTLFGKIQELSGYHSVNIADGILEQVALGKNPKDIATWITDAYGYPLTDSMRQVRTAQLYSYRQSNNAVQIANEDLLEGVVWCAELGPDTCASCFALHGQVFPVGTVCNDHHNGRCDILPWVKGMENPISQSGEDWVKEQPEKVQSDIMGKGKYEAWKEGKFEFNQLSTNYENDVFGTMKRESTLSELLGG